jgi:hypothetical protein
MRFVPAQLLALLHGLSDERINVRCVCSACAVECMETRRERRVATDEGGTDDDLFDEHAIRSEGHLRMTRAGPPWVKSVVLIVRVDA